MLPKSIESLITALQAVPSIGKKTAQRMAMQLIIKDKVVAKNLRDGLQAALQTAKICEKCRNISDSNLCGICTNLKRDITKICITNSVIDLIAIEKTSSFNGIYFVLHGELSPIRNITPKSLGIDKLQARAKQEGFKEIIIATNSTAEGQATAHYIEQCCRDLVVTISRPAQGLPMGGELEFVDSLTLKHAINSRK